MRRGLLTPTLVQPVATKNPQPFTCTKLLVKTKKKDKTSGWTLDRSNATLTNELLDFSLNVTVSMCTQEEMWRSSLQTAAFWQSFRAREGLEKKNCGGCLWMSYLQAVLKAGGVCNEHRKQNTQWTSCWAAVPPHLLIRPFCLPVCVCVYVYNNVCLWVCVREVWAK